MDTTYLTRTFAREAVSFIERHASAPFFLYAPFNAVHVPMQEDPATLSRITGITNVRRRQYLSMLTSMDDAVGEVLATLDRLKLAQNTLVIFVSDNGGPTDRTTSSNAPFRGDKGTLFEGGIGVPFAARWREGAFAEWNRGMQRPRGLLPGFLGMMQQWFRTRNSD